MANDSELLCSGFVRLSLVSYIPYDVAVLIGQFIGFHDEWDPTACDKSLCIENNGDKLRCVRNEYMRPYYTDYVKYALGLKSFRIDCAKSQNQIIQWKLKLRSGRKRKNNHVCCGIGIVKREKYEKNLRHAKFDLFSSNVPHILNLEKIGYDSLIGFQCGAYMEQNLRPNWRGYKRWQPCYHFVTDMSNKDHSEMNDKSCFMHRDIVRLVLDLKVFTLEIYVNGSLVPRYKRSISDIESGEYSLCVWLHLTKHSMQIIA